ncbi:GIY-YIG nuclease family protein [Alteromonas halophila]|uniref:GIY-YIG domain-containing protein n=1 Tax=Alteromonas halophila TaxID=516698 RepID=A0A918JN15_9ALTE|nr:GIY-YIG nuclease family protein [Alteromonas halophila]GGW87106.1 hypothetical protein GCM10007391_21170 [Alteromonas halophila]
MPISISAIDGDADAQKWYIYLIENRLGHLYTGITCDPARRIAQHRGLRRGGAKALRGKAPLYFRGVFQVAGKSAAMHIEYQLKQLPARLKWQVIDNQNLAQTKTVTMQFSDSENTLHNQCNTKT